MDPALYSTVNVAGMDGLVSTRTFSEKEETFPLNAYFTPSLRSRNSRIQQIVTLLLYCGAYRYPKNPTNPNFGKAVTYPYITYYDYYYFHTAAPPTTLPSLPI
jgi:hypothetical protein